MSDDSLETTGAVIFGVSTSVTAFVGVTKAGTINTPAHCYSFEDYEQQFGGLDPASEVSYAVLQFFANGGTDAIVIRVVRSADSDALSFVNAIHALGAEDDFSLLCLPGTTEPFILVSAAEYCRARRAFLIADAPEEAETPDKMVALVGTTALPKSDHAAVYFPWLDVADPLNAGEPRRVPPCGSVAGAYAKTDSTRGVWKAPAGKETSLAGVLKPAFVVTDDENAALNPRGINCVRDFPEIGAVIWGARTLAGDDQAASEWKYIPVRRTALFIEDSLYRGLEWVVFEPNGEPLWQRVRASVETFMFELFRQGAFQGTSPRDAYFVKCDRDTTTQDDLNQGIVNIHVGFAPLKPAEFVILRLQQLAATSEPAPDC